MAEQGHNQGGEMDASVALDPALSGTNIARAVPSNGQHQQAQQQANSLIQVQAAHFSSPGTPTQGQQQRGPSFPPLNQATGYYPSQPLQQATSAPLQYYSQPQISHSAHSLPQPILQHSHQPQQIQQQQLYYQLPGVNGDHQYGQVSQGYQGQYQQSSGSVAVGQPQAPQPVQQTYQQLSGMAAYNQGLTLPPMQGQGVQQGSRSPRPSLSAKLIPSSSAQTASPGGDNQNQQSSSSPTSQRRGPPTSLHNTPVRNQAMPLPSPAQIQYAASQPNGMPMYTVMASPVQSMFAIPGLQMPSMQPQQGYPMNGSGGQIGGNSHNGGQGSPPGMRVMSIQQDPFLGGPQYAGLTPTPMNTTFGLGVHASIERVASNGKEQAQQQHQQHPLSQSHVQTGSREPSTQPRADEGRDHEMEADRDEQRGDDLRKPESSRRKEREQEDGEQGQSQYDPKAYYGPGQGDKNAIHLPSIQNVLPFPTSAFGPKLAPMEPHDRQFSGGSTSSDISGMILPAPHVQSYHMGQQQMQYQAMPMAGHGQQVTGGQPIFLPPAESGRQIYYTQNGYMVQAPQYGQMGMQMQIKQEPGHDNGGSNGHQQMAQPQSYYVAGPNHNGPTQGGMPGFQAMISPSTGAVQYVQMAQNGQGQNVAYTYALAPQAFHPTHQQQQPPASFARQNAFSYNYSDADEGHENGGNRLRRMSETSIEDTDHEQGNGRGINGRNVYESQDNDGHPSNALEQIDELPEEPIEEDRPQVRKSSQDFRPKTGRPKKNSIKLMDTSITINKKTVKKKAAPGKGTLPGSARTPAMTPGSLLPPVDPDNITYTSWSDDKQTETVRRECFTCCNRDPPSWRRSPINGNHILCNRCGIYERSHGVPRPVLDDEMAEIARNNRLAKSAASASAKVVKKAGAAAGKKKRKTPAKSSIASVSAAADHQVEDVDMMTAGGDAEQAGEEQREDSPLTESGQTPDSPSDTEFSPRTPWSAKLSAARQPLIMGSGSPRRTRSSAMQSPDHPRLLEAKDINDTRYQSAMRGTANRMFEHSRQESYNTTSTYDESAERGT